MGGFFNFIIEMKSVFLAKSIDRRPRGWGFLSGSSIAGNWSRYNLCDIVTKASVAFVVSTDPDVHFKCCISADSKVQAFIKHETKGKPIRACRVHSGALDELTSQQFRQLHFRGRSTLQKIGECYLSDHGRQPQFGPKCNFGS